MFAIIGKNMFLLALHVVYGDNTENMVCNKLVVPPNAILEYKN